MCEQRTQPTGQRDQDHDGEDSGSGSGGTGLELTTGNLIFIHKFITGTCGFDDLYISFLRSTSNLSYHTVPYCATPYHYSTKYSISSLTNHRPAGSKFSLIT